MRRLRSVWHSVNNLVAYAPVVWRDRDWDHAFLFRLLAFKFQRMADYFHESGLVEGSDEISNQCATAAELCRRIADEDYCEDEWEEHHRKYPKWTIETNDARTKESVAISEEADRRLKRDIASLCDLIRDNCLRWWD